MLKESDFLKPNFKTMTLKIEVNGKKEEIILAQMSPYEMGQHATFIAKKGNENLEIASYVARSIVDENGDRVIQDKNIKQFAKCYAADTLLYILDAATTLNGHVPDDEDKKKG